jgi:hypothetical protein
MSRVVQVTELYVLRSKISFVKVYRVKTMAATAGERVTYENNPSAPSKASCVVRLAKPWRRSKVMTDEHQERLRQIGQLGFILLCLLQLLFPGSPRSCEGCLTKPRAWGGASISTAR